VARTYAGILGPLAFLTSLAHGLVHGGATVSVLWTSWCCLLAFSAVGYVCGWTADRVVEDSVRTRILAELAARQHTDAAQSPATGP